MRILLAIYFLLCIGQNAWSQRPTPPACGFSKTLNKQIERALASRARLTSPQDSYDSTTVYTLPVVIHVYHLGEAIGTGNNVSEAFIAQVIKDLNDGFGAQDAYIGQRDTKIQFTLASRSPTCQPTNGVVRVNASNILNYADSGIWVGDAAMIDTLRAISSWPDDYINIRLVKSPYAQAWAYFLNDMFFPISWPWPGRRGALIHEMGHILTLHHTFEGDNNNAQCPPNTDPESEGDLVSDTDPHKINDNCYTYADTDINACTANPFGRILHNFMAYSCDEEFTKGQIRRMRLAIINSRPEWLNSLALVTPSVVPPLPVAACNVVSVNGRSFLYGFEKFHFGSYQVGANPPQYGGKTLVDRTCLQRITATVSQPYSLYLRAFYQTWLRFRVYIDYNNNGIFDLPDEMAAENTALSEELNTTVTPPASAVKNIPLRLRVVGDRAASTPCEVTGDAFWKAGNAHDFTITITDPCPNSLLLSSANVPTDDVTAGTTLRKASADIIASNKILGTANVTYQFGTSVLLQEGFLADTGTVFKTQSGGCN